MDLLQLKEDGFWSKSVISYLTHSDLGALEQGATGIVTEEHWKALVARDFSDGDSTVDKDAPYWLDRDRKSFDVMRTFRTYKISYRAWLSFKRYTSGMVTCRDIRSAIKVWSRYKGAVAMRDKDSGRMLERDSQPLLSTLEGAPEASLFAFMASEGVPSSYGAILAVHGGQESVGNQLSWSPFSGLFDSASADIGGGVSYMLQSCVLIHAFQEFRCSIWVLVSNAIP